MSTPGVNHTRGPRRAAAAYGDLPGLAPRAGRLVVFLLSCAPIVRQPPFSERPDTVRTADLLGPYDGRVVDADSGEPLEGASVAASWRFVRGVGLRGPAGGCLVEAQTDADGRYRVPAIEDPPTGLSSTVASFTLILYKRGYHAYRSDRVVTPRGVRPRRDFAQRGNRVELRRLGPEDRHAEHLAFLGVWGAPRSIARAAEWEVQAAVAESVAAGGAPVPPARLDAARLLLVEDVRDRTGYAGAFESRKLRDPPPSESADSLHLRAADASERFDVALRVWRLAPEEAARQYAKLLGAYPESVRRDELLDRSFRAAEGDILALGVLDESRGLVLALTCGVGLCPDHDVLVRLAQRVVERAAGGEDAAP